MDDMAIDMYLFLGAAILCLAGTLVCFFISRHPRRWRKQYAYKFGMGYKLGDDGGKRAYDKKSKLIFTTLAGILLLSTLALGWLCWSAHKKANQESAYDRAMRKGVLGDEDSSTGVPSSSMERSARRLLDK